MKKDRIMECRDLRRGGVRNLSPLKPETPTALHTLILNFFSSRDVAHCTNRSSSTRSNPSLANATDNITNSYFMIEKAHWRRHGACRGRSERGRQRVDRPATSQTRELGRKVSDGVQIKGVTSLRRGASVAGILRTQRIGSPAHSIS